MIIRTRYGNRELRSEWGQSSRIPLPGSGYFSSAGIAVTEEQAYGLPAVSNVIRSPAEIVATLPLLVYEKGETRERAEASWQWRLLHDLPNFETDPVQFFYDLALSLEATQNAFVHKAKLEPRGRVYDLVVLDPQTVSVRRDRVTRERIYEVWNEDGRKEVPKEDIIHVRGFTPRPGGIAGVSLIQQHRDPIGAMAAMSRFEGDYFRNGGIPPFWFKGAKNREHAQQLIDAHNEAHAGVGKQWKPGGLWGDAEVIAPVGLSLEDAKFADAKKLSIEDACRIWRWPKQLLELAGEEGPTDENAWTARVLKFYLLHRLKRIESAFNADPDLFPTSGVGSGRAPGARLFGEFLTAALERADFVTRVRGYKDARQGSWITANEIRRMENLPPVDGGDEILITPTGSAPNPENESSNGSGDPDKVALLAKE